jgi:acetyltransferase-like isoleucine patch superfamily enzyme
MADSLPEILESEPEKRPVGLKGMSMARKVQLALAGTRSLTRGLVKPGQVPFVHARVRILKQNGEIKLGKFCELHDSVVLYAINPDAGTPARLHIGDYTSIWFRTVISARHDIRIGSHCAISWNCSILDNDMHEVLFRPEDKPRERGNFVHIEDHVWIGTGCTILRGVTIGRNSVVAAGSVVTRDVPPNTLVAGSPAKVIKEIRGWR